MNHIRHVCIEGEVRELSPSSIREKIGDATYNEIRARDPHPCFVSIVAAEEGTSTGSLKFPGAPAMKALKLWGADIISGLAGMFGRKRRDGKRPRVWDGHPGALETRELADQGVGEVVHSETFRNKAGKVAARVLAYIAPGTVRDGVKAGRLNTASLEANVLWERVSDAAKGAAQWAAREVKDVLGIILADSKVDKPGFSCARVAAVVQELEDIGYDDVDTTSEGATATVTVAVDDDGNVVGTTPKKKRRGRRRRNRVDKEDVLDPIELKGMLERAKLRPEDVFSAEQLAGSGIVKGAAESHAQEQVDSLGREHEAKLAELQAGIESEKAEWANKEGELLALQERIAPFLAQEKRGKLEELARTDPSLSDVTEAEMSWVLKRLPVAVMDEPVETRGVKIAEAIARSKGDLEEAKAAAGATTQPAPTGQPGNGGIGPAVAAPKAPATRGGFQGGPIAAADNPLDMAYGRNK